MVSQVNEAKANEEEMKSVIFVWDESLKPFNSGLVCVFVFYSGMFALLATRHTNKLSSDDWCTFHKISVVHCVLCLTSI